MKPSRGTMCNFLSLSLSLSLFIPLSHFDIHSSPLIKTLMVWYNCTRFLIANCIYTLFIYTYIHKTLAICCIFQSRSRTLSLVLSITRYSLSLSLSIHLTLVFNFFSSFHFFFSSHTRAYRYRSHPAALQVKKNQQTCHRPARRHIGKYNRKTEQKHCRIKPREKTK